MPTIVTTLWRRLDYTKKVFSSINECIGVDKYSLLAFAEPGCQEVLDFASEFHFNGKEYLLTINPTRLGCGKNIHQAVAAGFARDDFVIMVEDDIVLAADALRYFEHCKDAYKDDKCVFTVCGYAKTTPAIEWSHSVKKEPWFTPWGWATWADRWAEIDKCVREKIAEGTENSPSWDMVVNHQIRGDRSQAEPILSRTQNIGAEMGAYCPSKKWHEENCFNEHGAWSVQLDHSTPFEEAP